VELHVFGERIDGKTESCIIHGEVRRLMIKKQWQEKAAKVKRPSGIYPKPMVVYALDRWTAQNIKIRSPSWRTYP
jgi:hypothetical protein